MYPNKTKIGKLFSNLLILSLIVQASIGLFAFPNQAKAAGNTYYVANAGNDSCDGTSQTIGSSGACAWKTISHVNAQTFLAGDSILFNGGDTWREGLVPPSSGNAGNNITFGSYGTGQAIINGSAVFSSWTTESYTGNTNLCPNPAAINLWASGYGKTVATNVASPLAPDGTQTADGIIPDTSTGFHVALTNFAASPSTVYTLSVYVYPGASKWFQLQGDDNTSGFSYLNSHTSWFNLSGAGFAQSDTKQNISASGITYDSVNGWYHVWITWTTAVNTGQIEPSLYMATANGVDNFTGDGTSVYTYAWGAKAEQGSSVSVINNRTLYYSSYSTAPNIGFKNSTLLPAATPSKLDLVSGRFWVDTGNSRIYVYDNPSGQTMEFGDGGHTPVSMDGKNYVTLNNLNITHGNYDGILLENSTNILVDGVNSSYNYVRGIDNGGDAGDFSSNITVQNGTFNNNGTSGVEFHGGGGSAGQLHDLTISGNTVANNGWQIATAVWTSGIKIWGGYGGTSLSYNATIQNNDVYGTANTSGAQGQIGSAVGIWVDEWGTGAVVRYNKTHANDGSGIAFEHHSGSVAYGNILYNNSIYWTTSAQLQAFRSASNILMYNNTCYGGTICYGVQGLIGEAVMVNNILKNNIAFGYSARALSATYGGENASGGSGNIYDHNAFGAESSNFIEWGNGVYKSTYSAFDSAYGASTHSIIGDPLFTTNGSNFSLLSTSPAIDTGTSLGDTYKLGLNPNSVWPNGVNTLDQTLNGLGWDIGAYIYTENTPPTVSLTAPTDGTTVSGSSVTLSATATDNSAVAGVQFKLDTNTNIGAEDTTSPYGVTWDSTAVLDGTHTLIAVARDTYGNYATSSAVMVTVHNAVASGGGNGAPVGLIGQHTQNISNLLTPTIPVSTSTSLTSLQDQIASLTLQLNSLLAQAHTTTATSYTPYNFTRNLSLHATGADVKQLQQFLNVNGFIISTTGAGSLGNETTLFGLLTYKALTKFQKSVGLPATGFFGPMTRAVVNGK